MLNQSKKISISIVSHLQATMVYSLLLDLDRLCAKSLHEVILTLNLPEDLTFDIQQFSFPVVLLNNPTPMGFGANHNQAFKASSGDFFCVLNPDIRLYENPFDALSLRLRDVSIGVVAPIVLGKTGAVEDSARRFPTVLRILRKFFSKEWTSDYAFQHSPIDVDWIGGMFLLFRRPIYEQLNGFNERYFLYYEDVEICARLHLAGFRVVVDPSARVTHHAQHTSHRNLKYLRWHVSSLLRFLGSSEYRQLKRLNRL